MQNLNQRQTHFLLVLAIVIRGDVLAMYPLQRYKAIQGPPLKSMVREPPSPE